MPFGVKIKGQGFDIELTDLGPEDVGNIVGADSKLSHRAD